MTTSGDTGAIRHPGRVEDRARDLEGAGLNGLQLVLVSLDDPDPATGAPRAALLEVRFVNALHLEDIVDEIAVTPEKAGEIFVVKGGSRIPAGPGAAQVHVVSVETGAARTLVVTVAPIGDYSTYTLELRWDPEKIDPFFSSVPFKFRPGCFTNPCAPAPSGPPPTGPAPVVDYLARDYDSFRHALMAAMAARVPEWRSTSEADLDQVLIDLLAAAGDELSDYQDRVMSEAYLATARKRTSIVRHARLVDYHVHEGQQATTWLAVDVVEGTVPFRLDDDELRVWAGGDDERDPRAVVFATREALLAEGDRARLDPLTNRLRLHTWGDAQPALRAGATQADVVVMDVPGAGKPEAEQVRDLIRSGTLRRLLIEEVLNPRTGQPRGRDARKRQLLTLRTGRDAAESLRDPLTGTWLVRVRWEPQDRLRQDYAFTTFCVPPGQPTGPVTDVSLFRGNLVRVHHGRPVETVFHPPGTSLPADDGTTKHRWWEVVRRHDAPRSVRCPLPDAPLAYLPRPPGAAGEVEPRSTLVVTIAGTRWEERASLVRSGEDDAHFVVETDERRRSVVRFGCDDHGRRPPQGATIRCRYQVGAPEQGNVGADRLVRFRLDGPHSADLVTVRNPLDVSDGRAPELVAEVVRHAPEAYRARQLRAVTLDDYRRRAEEVPGIDRAAARYAWTGSWRTVRVVVDPSGAVTLSPELRARVAAHLEAVRLIGEDLEIRPPRYVPLDIRVALCISAEFWPEDLRSVLEQEFSTGYTPDGRRGFFHPDEWTFGDALRESQIAGRLERIAGIEHVASISMKRFDAATPGAPTGDVVEMGFDEILDVENDPDHLERGIIRFDLRGGRR